MNFLIVTPVPKESTRGNRITAKRWSNILNDLGHQTTILERFDRASAHHIVSPFDGLIALHATRSADSISEFKLCYPEKPVVLCLTGTDLHADLQGQNGPEACSTAQNSLDVASRIVILEPEGRHLLKDDYQDKLTTIYQSATPLPIRPERLTDRFEVTVIGHLRFEKDPFRTAMAARLLPSESRIEIVHLGNALTPKMRAEAIQESKSNDRYHWLGGLSHDATLQRLARSHLTVLSSRIEGAPSVVSEAIVNNVPILATRIPASIGTLGADYPGLFEVEDTDQLARMLRDAETDPTFYDELCSAVQQLQPRFTLENESKSWRRLIDLVFG